MTEPYEHLSPSLGVRPDAFGNPVGKPLPGWQACARPPEVPLDGRTCRVIPYVEAHASPLHAAFAADDGRMWSYLPYGPYDSANTLHADITDWQAGKGWQTFSILKDGTPIGVASYMRHDLANGSVEVGGVTFSPALQRSTVATEAMYLMMRHAFEHGFRRYEWKCDQLNIPSNKAALRLGFSFEGVFRNAIVNKGRRRDTAWYSVIVEEWPQVRARLETWLSPDNFDTEGRQIIALNALPKNW